jgi:hypothetical protein
MIGNSKVFDSIFPQSPDDKNPAILESKLIDRVFGWAEVVKNIARFLVLFFQRWSHEDLIIQGTSLESGNKQGQIALYEWSKRVVSQWLTTSTEVKDMSSQEAPRTEEEGEELLLV